ncbi:NUDIX hydrolase [Halobacillus karajensis]|uniref:Nudix hydrolase domain-containing protein n=1 Tax=Halobacillus karajensis TaxID=195088 RepID=A0A059NXK4_9BACI|nr:hypothetical protein [Halobacillus karajensis]CDQ18450.1 hypothetical protein BN982_00722 [Halobacillus karajensis]CDQ23478.1 hypothetical protein BN983_01706 [Halobacillus karajensis]CDQ26960.1 hypothetical protein BN981_01186 [Halobacillus karajensis]
MAEELGYDVKVERMVWTAESFFKHRGEAMHEVAFYYLLKTREAYFQEGPFYGLEGDRLIYQWIPLEGMEDLDVRPVFFMKALKDVPRETTHLIMKG